MKIIKIKNKHIRQSDLKKIIFCLKKGGIIIYPTETAYALGGDALNREVVKKIFSLKSRSKKNPLPVIVGSLNQAKKIAVFDQCSRFLAKKHWPGPLTLVLPKKKNIPPLLTANKRKIAIRISGFLWAREIAEKLRRPLISTSANVSGQEECYTVGAILKQFSRVSKEVNLALDAGRLPKVKPSTVVEVKNGKLKVLREGPVNLTGSF